MWSTTYGLLDRVCTFKYSRKTAKVSIDPPIVNPSCVAIDMFGMIGVESWLAIPQSGVVLCSVVVDDKRVRRFVSGGNTAQRETQDRSDLRYY